MNIPNEVKIGGVIYEVSEVDKIEIGGNSNYAGAIQYGKATIELLNDIEGQYRDITFLHEVLHGIFNFLNFDFEDEEDIVERLSRALHMFIQDNPKVFTCGGDCECSSLELSQLGEEVKE